MAKFPLHFGAEKTVSTAQEVMEAIKTGTRCNYKWTAEARDGLFTRFDSAEYSRKDVGQFLDNAAKSVAFTINEMIYFTNPATPKEDRDRFARTKASLAGVIAEMRDLGPAGVTAMSDHDWSRRPEIEWSYSWRETGTNESFSKLEFINAGPQYLMVIARDLISILDGAGPKLKDIPDRSGRRYTSTRFRNRLITWLTVSFQLAFKVDPPISIDGPFSETVRACDRLLGFDMDGDFRNRITAARKKALLHMKCQGESSCVLDNDRENCPYPQFGLQAHD